MNSELPSERTEESSNDRSVFDFLYNDSRRVASYLSQFEGGHLTQLTRSNETGSSTSEQSGRDFSLGVTRVLGGGSRSSETEGESAKEGLVRTFDPYWTNARAFLDFLNERDLIENDIWDASMGQFVLVRGKLAILDLASMQSVWSMPLFKKMMGEHLNAEEASSSENRQQRRSQPKPGGKDPFDSQPTIVRLAMELLPSFPHSTVASIMGEFWSTWSTLSAEHLVGSPSDLMLKHGNKIAGEWAMLGVLDALPDGDDSAIDEVDKYLLGLQESNIVAQASLGLTPVMRMVAGRPPQSFGMTPLLIFRDIAKRT
ncbi:hypothetical protein QP162_12720 [Sphingomonas aurantiaca]|uniref:DUF6414 family protein n=1 Tax=Sphingomonas aurantiaca TaxID=185949 RepID=UPI002FE2C465